MSLEEEPPNLEEMASRFREENPEAARALDLFHISLERYNSIIGTVQAPQIHQGPATGGAPSGR
jgi:hypothetical protein